MSVNGKYPYTLHWLQRKALFRLEEKALKVQVHLILSLIAS